MDPRVTTIVSGIVLVLVFALVRWSARRRRRRVPRV